MGARKESLPAKEFCASPAVFGLRVSALGFPALGTAVETTDFTDNTDKGGIAARGVHLGPDEALSHPCYPCNPWFLYSALGLRPSFGLRVSAFGFPIASRKE